MCAQVRWPHCGGDALRAYLEVGDPSVLEMGRLSSSGGVADVSKTKTSSALRWVWIQILSPTVHA